jgi:hypothetical protein
MSETHVRLYNPDTGGVWDCPVDAVEGYLRRGWVKSDKPLAGEGEEYPADDIDAQVGVDEWESELAVEFDPSEHTVAEVQEHMAENPDDADRVLEAEAAGKNRVSLTGDNAEDTDGE